MQGPEDSLLCAVNGENGATAAESELGMKITSKAILELLERQKKRCAITGRELSPKTASIDHEHPLSRGGSNTMNNVQIVHRDVNQAKGTMTNDEFVLMCRDVVTWSDATRNYSGSGS